MSESLNLWGDYPDVNTFNTPLTILREQAEVLRQMTKGLLDPTVEVRSYPGSGILSAKLVINVPALDSYSVSILEISYGPTVYPVSLKTPFIGEVMGTALGTAKNEEEFIKNLGGVLQSYDIKNVIKSLIAQVKDKS